jgi:hypothetical protein
MKQDEERKRCSRQGNKQVFKLKLLLLTYCKDLKTGLWKVSIIKRKL